MALSTETVSQAGHGARRNPAEHPRLPAIAPSLLNSDLGDTQAALAEIAASGAMRLHCDVMDGHFVPSLGLNPKLIADIRRRSGLFVDVHLMTERPEQYLGDLVAGGADAITFHLEACVHANRLVRQIREAGRSAGIALAPGTPVAAISELAPDLDEVLLMSVNPGFAGESFMPSSLTRIAELARQRSQGLGSYRIVVDGGLDRKTARQAIEAGADVVVMGRAFFAAEEKAAEVAAVLQQA